MDDGRDIIYSDAAFEGSLVSTVPPCYNKPSFDIKVHLFRIGLAAGEGN